MYEHSNKIASFSFLIRFIIVFFLCVSFFSLIFLRLSLISNTLARVGVCKVCFVVSLFPNAPTSSVYTFWMLNVYLLFFFTTCLKHFSNQTHTLAAPFPECSSKKLGTSTGCARGDTRIHQTTCG